MARIRSIKPTYFKSRSLARVTRDARYLFAGLWTYCDDEGRGADDARLIKSELFPLDDDVTPKTIEGWLTALTKIGVIVRYEVDGWKYLAVTHFGEHQKPNKPQASKLPAPPGTPTDPGPSGSGKAPGTVGGDNGKTPARKGIGEGEGGGREEEGRNSSPPGGRAGAREEDHEPPGDALRDDGAPNVASLAAWAAFVHAPAADGARPHGELVADFFATLPSERERLKYAALANTKLQEGLTPGALYDVLDDWVTNRPAPGLGLWRRYLDKAARIQAAQRRAVTQQAGRLQGATDDDRAQFAEWERQAREEEQREAAALAVGEVPHG